MLWAGAAAIALLTAGTAALAQDAPAEAAADVEEVVVTGSLIRGAAPVGSSLISVGAEAIKESTAPTIGEFLKNVPQVLGLGIDPGHKTGSGSGNRGFGSSINLRGLGAGATLLLYNGQRLPRSGGFGGYVDNSSIPGIALQRVEVIADGASAIYGSDAVAGVVNLITRRNVSGLELNAQAGFADSTSNWGVSGITGKSWTGGQVMFAADYTYQGRLNAGDRPYSRSLDLRPYGGSDLRNTSCSPGTVTMGGKNYALPTLTPGTNLCDTIQYNDLLPQVKRWTVMAHVEQEITDKVLFEAEGFFNRREYNYHAALGSGRGFAPAGITLTVPVTNAFYQPVPGVAPGPQVINTFLGPALGNYLPDFGPEETWTMNAHLRVDLPSEWRLNLNATRGHNWNKTNRYNLNNAALVKALASSDPATSINPYAPSPNTPKAVVDALTQYQSIHGSARNELESYKAQIDGPLFDLPGGPVKLAAGAEHRIERYYALTELGPNGNFTGTPFSIDRKVDSLYAEANAPILSPENEVTGIRRLTLSLAGRYEKYNDFGNTFNPKVGLTWEPVDGVSVRGSVGKSFRAPDLSSLIPVQPGNGNVFLLPSPDPKAGGAIVLVGILSGGNPDLQPEKARTYSAGIDFTPSSLPGFRAGATYFNIHYSNVILTLVMQNPLAKEALYPDQFSRDPAYIASTVTAFLARGATYNPAPPTSLASIAALVNGTFINAGVTDLDGVDFDASYRWTVDSIGQLEIGAVGTYYNSFKVAASPVAPSIESVNTYGNPPRFRTRVHGGWRDGPWNANVYFNHTSGYQDVTQKRRISANDTFDIDAGVELGDVIQNGFTSNTRIILSVSNVFDKDPPFYNGYLGYDPQIASAIGRRFQISLDKKF